MNTTFCESFFSELMASWFPVEACRSVESCQVAEGMLRAETDWDEVVLRTAARAFRAWRHAVAQEGQVTTFLQVTDFLFFTADVFDLF